MNGQSSPRSRRENSLPSLNPYHNAKAPKTSFSGWELLARRFFLRVRSHPERSARIGTGIGGLFVLWLFLRTGSDKAFFGSARSGYTTAPRIVTFYYEGEDTHIPIVQTLDLNMERYPSKRQIRVHQDDLDAQKRLKDSKDYKRGRVEPFETDKCKAQYDWQKTSHPTCNTVYEFDLSNLHADKKNDERVRIISNGYWRDVWMVREDHTDTKRVLKTMRYRQDFVPRNYDRHRRDAVAMERLTSSKYVVDIYGFCGNSGIFEYSEGGDINDAIWPEDDNAKELSNVEKLRIGK